ncbi:Pyrroline-5-carboxylate reductase [Balamuthia mandrillaris]
MMNASNNACRRLSILSSHVLSGHDAYTRGCALEPRPTASSSQPRVAFIGGGQMATALACGLIASSFTTPQNIIASDLHEFSRKKFVEATKANATPSNLEAVKNADIIILAVKPQVLHVVFKELRPHLTTNSLVISIAAGFDLAALLQGLGEHLRVVRVMPNTPALVGKGASAFSLGGKATKEDAETVRRLLSGVGLAFEVPEKLLDGGMFFFCCCANTLFSFFYVSLSLFHLFRYSSVSSLPSLLYSSLLLTATHKNTHTKVTGLSGSGPAYVYQFIEAMSDGGVRMGVPREVATQLAAQTVLGAAQMVLETGEHPGQLKDKVTSPGGTTIAGIHALERGGLRATVMNAVEAAALKARELGGK